MIVHYHTIKMDASLSLGHTNGAEEKPNRVERVENKRF
jgi:hypothetical protein